MNDETYVGLVDAHAKSNGRANHAHFVADEQFLIRRARLGVETRVIRFSFDPVCIQARRHIFRAVSALAVNDAAIAWPPLDETQKLSVGTVFRQHAIGEVRPIETRDVTTRLTQTKLLNDVRAHSCRRGGGERHRSEEHTSELQSPMY